MRCCCELIALALLMLGWLLQIWLLLWLLLPLRTPMHAGACTHATRTGSCWPNAPANQEHALAAVPCNSDALPGHAHSPPRQLHDGRELTAARTRTPGRLMRKLFGVLSTDDRTRAKDFCLAPSAPYYKGRSVSELHCFQNKRANSDTPDCIFQQSQITQLVQME